MPYYCKKCGAVVDGKFCSCCGTRATTDLADFRRELNRRARAFRTERYHNSGDFDKLHAADFAWGRAEWAILRPYTTSAEAFPLMSDLAYAKLPVVEERAASLYEQVMCAVHTVL